MALFLFPELMLSLYFMLQFSLVLIGTLVPSMIGTIALFGNGAFFILLLWRTRFTKRLVLLLSLFTLLGFVDLLSTIGLHMENLDRFLKVESNIILRSTFRSGNSPLLGVLLLLLFKANSALMMVRFAELYDMTKAARKECVCNRSFLFTAFRLGAQIRKSAEYREAIPRFRGDIDGLRLALRNGAFLQDYYIHAYVVYGAYYLYILWYVVVIAYNLSVRFSISTYIDNYVLVGSMLIGTLIVLWNRYQRLN